ncbi:MAG: O-antigen ligase family protein [Acidobacteriota bacterium]
MKWVLFIAFAAVAVPVAAVLCALGGRYRAGLLALLVVTPFFGDLVNINVLSVESYRGPDRGFEISLTDLLALGMAFGLLARPNRIRRIPPGTVLCLLLFAVAVAGVLFAPQRLFAAFTLFKALRLYLLLFVVFETVRQGIDLAWTYRAWAGMGCISALLVLKQKYLEGIYRIHLLFDHSNTVPLFLNLVMPIVLLWALAGPGPRPAIDSWLGTVGALGMVGAVTMTYSRAGLVLAGAAVGAVLVVAVLKRPSVRSFAGVAAISVLGVIGLSLVADSLLYRFLNAPKASGEARNEFNQAAQAMAEDHLLGVGINQYPRVLSDDGRYRKFIGVMANEKEAGVVHHIYWLTAAELGFVGLALFLLLLLRFWAIAFGLMWSPVPTDALTGFGAFFGFGLIHAHGFLEWALRISPVAYFFAIVCGLVGGLGARRRFRISDVTRAVRWLVGARWFFELFRRRGTSR